MPIPVAILTGRIGADARPPRGRVPIPRARTGIRDVNPRGGIAPEPRRVDGTDTRRRATAFAAGSVDDLDADDDDDDDPKMSKEELKRRAVRASAPRETPEATRAKSSSGAASLLPQLVDGAEVFFLLAAGGTRAASAYDSAQRRAAYVAANPSAPPPPPVPLSAWAADAALFGAVAAGAVIRRRSPPDSEPSGPGAAVRARRTAEGYAPTGVFARVKNLEMSQDRIAASVDRANRDLSRVSTRVRATRRELSPSLRKVEARTEEQAQYSAAMERRLATLGDEVKAAQETMMALTDMTAKQFGALSAAVKELKEAGAAAPSPPPAAAPSPPPPAAAPAPASSPAQPVAARATDGGPDGEERREQQPPPPRPPRPPRPQRKPWSGAGWPGAVELAAQEAGGSFRTDRVTDEDGNVTETRQMNVNRRRLTTLRVGGQQPRGQGRGRGPGARRAKPARTIAGKSAEEGTGSSGNVGGSSDGGSGGGGARLRRARERAPEWRTSSRRACRVLDRRVSIFQFLESS